MTRITEWVRIMKERVGTRKNGRKAAVVITAVVFLVVVLAVYSRYEPKGHGAHPSAADEHAGRGDAATVTLSEEARKIAGIEVWEVVPQALSAPIEATAAIELNNDRLAKISARTSGRLVRLVASQGDTVRTGDALEYFDSPELGQAWTDHAKAKGRVDAARKNLQREETLFEKKISPEKDVIRARQELSEAEADLGLANEKFHLLGIEINQFEKPHEGYQHPLIAVSSPINGSVIERTVTQGEVVGPDKTLFTVADLSALWVIIDLYEKDLGRVKPGTSVKVATAAYPEKVFHGVISYLGDVMDDKTRTVKARVVVDNANRLLKPGMFATVLIETTGGSERLITVPEEAVFLDGSKNYVFIQTAPEKFEIREVAVGRSLGKRLEIIRGLKKGEPVAVKGAFILKSELKKGELVD